MRVLLVEPYFGGSHRAWAEGLVAHSTHEMILVTHEAAFWRWRMRGGALTLAEEVERAVAEHGRPDVLLVSDMVDLPALLGFARRSLGDPAVVLYLHENQLLYPLGPTQQPDESLSIINWLSLAAADHVLFNSTFHRDALVAALPGLLGRAPDRPHAHRLGEVVAGSSVLPVGVDLDGIVDGRRADDDGGPPRVLWNQRWDHDKQPRAVLDALVGLAEEGMSFRLAFAGANERIDPREFHEAIQVLGDRVEQVGWLPRGRYVELLLRSDAVVSASRHEFFGVALVEAMAAGAVPVLPDRLSYPELVGERFRTAACYPDGALRSHLASVLADLGAARRAVQGLRAEMERFDWRVVAPEYDRRLSAIVSERQGSLEGLA